MNPPAPARSSIPIAMSASPPAPFSLAWIDAFARALTADAAFREAAAGWTGRIGFRVADEPGTPSVVLHLEDGAVVALHAASVEDAARTEYLLEADAEQWRRVLSGRTDPIAALMRKKLRLRTGSLGSLLPRTAAARRLVQVAAEVAAPARETTGRPADTSAEPSAEPPAETDVPTPDPDGSRTFVSTSARGLDTASYPFRLWQKAKRLGTWNPEDIDFGQDARDWAGLAPPEQDLLRRLAAVFEAGEEAVTVDLLPLIDVIAREGRLEEEMYLTSFLWEEAKHVELFHRFFQYVAGGPSDLSRYHTPAYRAIFAEALPRAMRRLRTDPSPLAQAEASVTYNLIVEGVLAETGYYGFLQVIERHHILPGMQQAVYLLRQDESRHLAYGVYLLSRLVRAHGAPVLDAVHARMNALLPTAVDVIREAFAPYDPVPLGLDPDDFIAFATTQFEKRITTIERVTSDA